MPWVSRNRTGSGSRVYWISIGLASVLFGILVGYALWGQSASLVSNVEQQLNTSDARMRNLEKRLQVLELQNGVGSAEAPAESSRAY